MKFKQIITSIALLAVAGLGMDWRCYQRYSV